MNELTAEDLMRYIGTTVLVRVVALGTEDVSQLAVGPLTFYVIRDGKTRIGIDRTVLEFNNDTHSSTIAQLDQGAVTE